jgi:hypothetical protein
MKAMGHGKHRGRRHPSRLHSPRLALEPSAAAVGAAERIHRNTAAHWRTLIDDPDHPGQRMEMHAYGQRQRARSRRLELGRVPVEPWTHVPSAER